MAQSIPFSPNYILKNKINLMNQGSRGSHITKIPKHDLFSSFSYVDHLTSGSMKIESEGPEKHKKSVESSMVNCIDLLRATRKFHLSSLQQKNYTASLKKENDQKQNKKYIIRRNKNQLKDTVNKTVLRKYLSGETSYLSPQVLGKKKTESLTKSYSKVSKHEKSICQRTVQKKQVQKQSNQQLRKYKDQSQMLQKQIEEIIPAMQNHIKFAIQQNNQYLIKPSKFYPTIHQNKQKLKEIKTPPCKGLTENIQELKFKEPFQTPLIKTLKVESYQKQPKKKYQCRLTSGKKDLFQLIRKGQYFAVEIELSVKNSLLTLKDRKDNNLLHHCILHGQTDIFEMILKKALTQGINLLQMQNKYRRNPEELGHLFGFFKKKSTCEAVQASKKHFQFEIALQVFKLYS